MEYAKAIGLYLRGLATIFQLKGRESGINHVSDPSSSRQTNILPMGVTSSKSILLCTQYDHVNVFSQFFPHQEVVGDQLVSAHCL